MNLTIKNQIAGTRSYLGGVVTVADSGSTTISRDLNVIIVGDAQFLSDITSINIILNNGVKDLNPGEANLLCQTLAQFSTEPLATLFLYYSLPVNIRQSTTTAANTTVWAMRNASGSPKQVVIEKIQLSMAFDAGTPLGRSLQRYEVRRFNTATPTGGTALTPVQMDLLAPATVVTDARAVDTGLSVTSVVFDNSFFVISCPATDATVVQYVRTGIPMKLAAGEGLAIRLNVAAVAGQSICGEVTWSER